ncbi:DNA oxidative demethylase AlkB [Novosphingobium sp.]|jgi:alkylated DNA repair protein (DNA oxidative demethylase)|uniref:DNA oxidative demethylase AlkB n=1 Tax=Novosphingobium sp. TaxID=1874826 RepID=UPI002FE06BE6
MTQPDMFASARSEVVLGPGAVLLGGFALDGADALLAEIPPLSAISPFRHMSTRSGGRLAVAMFNCGETGWVSDRAGYRYQAIDPETGDLWPALPPRFRDLAARSAEAAGYPGFEPDACLVNRYDARTRLSLHQDMDERDHEAPIVSVSLGLSATFLWGGLSRSDRPRRHRVHHGDVVVWGGPSRMVFHGVDSVEKGTHPATGAWRYNLTFRKAR